jgi:pyrroloquinoline quinone biosynthesis protein D
MIRLESYPTRREQILTQHAADTLVLLDPESGEYFALGEVGARIWELCDGTRSVADLVEILCQEYDAPADVIQADLEELLAELIEAKLVVYGA